jgi:phosphopantothenoylcysteine decarboxylase/phosphopantothenate--cysteine ligase
MPSELKNKNIILGVCGGIAAYKSVELLRLFKKAGAAVRVMMTANARHFVGPMTFEALSGQKVCSDLFEPQADAAMRHIDWADQADAVVVAPATANMIAKLANGIADDALSTLMLAVTAPVVICPSMNSNMYASQPVQRNVRRLEEDGYAVVTPEAGELACGTTGPGRLPEPAYIFEQVVRLFYTQDLAGRTVLVTAGPTYEAIDPVRFLGNPSSGKMGYAVARAAAQRGAKVILVSGPSALDAPAHVEVIRVVSAEEMARAVFDRIQGVDVVVKAAAVADYRPKERAAQKIKKVKKDMVLSLEKNTDILKELGRRKGDRFLVGFAAETEALDRNAAKKLTAKNLDIIAGNLIGSAATGFKSDTNQVTLYYRDGTREQLPVMDKKALAHVLWDRIVERLGRAGE